ncbi:S-layer homology domain-containing protein, partial [Candidatus Peregrinibacteria bacterium]|nr:S-layer homology domain-containing protein [Candidatus Peregrinibacteria bacterium]
DGGGGAANGPNDTDDGDDSTSLAGTGGSSTGGGGTGYPFGSSGSSDDAVVLAEDGSIDCGYIDFVDVSEAASYYTPIYEAWCLGIVHGRGALFFYPNELILRGEAAKVFANAFGYTTTDITGDYFLDVDAEDPEVAPYIEALTEAGILNGYGDGYFRPHQAITIYEVKVIFRRITGESVMLSADGTGGGTITRGGFMEFIMEYSDY